MKAEKCTADTQCASKTCPGGHQQPACVTHVTKDQTHRFCGCEDIIRPVFSNFEVVPARSLTTWDFWSTMDLRLTLLAEDFDKYMHVAIELVNADETNLKQICIININDCSSTPPEYITDFFAEPPSPTPKCACNGKEESDKADKGDVYHLFVRQKACMAHSGQFVQTMLMGKSPTPDVVGSSAQLPVISHVCRGGNPCNGHQCYQQHTSEDTSDCSLYGEEEPGYKCNCIKSFNGLTLRKKSEWKKGENCTEMHACSDETVHQCGNQTCERRGDNADLHECVTYKTMKSVIEKARASNWQRIPTAGSQEPSIAMPLILGSGLLLIIGFCS